VEKGLNFNNEVASCHFTWAYTGATTFSASSTSMMDKNMTDADRKYSDFTPSRGTNVD
tara:strand:+ start:84679 stop:84852 length:174 start_codon:yes stop_codon:yes gene_type:complete